MGSLWAAARALEGVGEEPEDDPEQHIDFTLATPSTLDLPKSLRLESRKENREDTETEGRSVVVTRPIIHARKVTSI